jgi:hypothetical protein
MKSISKLAAIVVFGAAAVVSCQKEPVENPSNTSHGAKIVTFTCTIDDSSSTRLTVDGDGKTTWDAGDKILIHGEYVGTKDGKQYSTVVTLGEDGNTISADGKTATIKFAVDENGVEGLCPYHRDGRKSTFYAAYPADAVKGTSSYYQTYEYTRFTNSNLPLMVGYDNDYTSENPHFVFENTCAMISFSLSSSFSSLVDSYTFVGNDGETIGYDYYSPRRYLKTSGSVDGAIPYNYGSETSGPHTSISGSVVCDGSTLNKFYIAREIGKSSIPFSSGFTIQFFKGGDLVYTASISNSITINIGDWLPLGDLTKHMKPYVAPSYSDHNSAITGATDLSSANGPANCYIITAPGAYKLPAVKGNNLEKSAGSVYGVEILWESYNDDQPVTSNSVIAAVDFDGPTNYVFFETPTTLKTGNALIAAKNNNDEIIWSWHIWVPESAINTISNATLYNKALMDRNLGAIKPATTSDVTLPTHGLYYQWGRKDPFVGSATSSGTSFSVIAGPVPINQTIQNPTTLFNVGEADEAGNWCTDDLSNLWSDSGAKGIYDPCPAGYHVPAYNDSYALYAKNNDDWTYDWDVKYAKYGDVVFPIAGWLSTSVTPSYSGERTIITSSTRHSAPRAYLKILRKDKSGYYYHNYFKTEATNVRCVAD